MLIQILYHTPIYIWLLLAVLLLGGYRAAKTSIVSWKALCIMPTIMLGWSAYAMWKRYQGEHLLFWITSLIIGIAIGFLIVRKLRLRFDKRRGLIEIAGSWKGLGSSL
jgi:hypothetical protein